MAVDLGVIRLIGSPAPIKKILASSGIYNSVVKASLNQAGKISVGSSELTLSNPAIQTAAESTFSATYIENTTNGLIDSVYRWLETGSAAPDFKIDLAAKKAEFASKVAKAVEKRAAKLPTCTTYSVTINADPLTMRCLPIGITPAKAAATVRHDIAGSKDFLDKQVITAASLKSSDSDKSVFQGQLKNAPKAYQKFKSSPLVLTVIVLLLATAVVFLSSSRMAGMKHAGFIFLGTGLFLVLFGLAINEAAGNKIIPKIELTDSVLQDSVRHLVRDGVDSLSNNFVVIGGVYSAIGGAAIGAFYWVRHRQPANPPAKTSK